MRPVIGLLTGLGPPPVWEPLVLALARWCEPRAASPGQTEVSAWLASGPAARGLDRARRSGLPTAVVDWPTAGLGAEVVLVSPGGDRVTVPHPGVAAGQAWPTPPFVRWRWRRRLGLGEHLVLDPAEVDDRLVPTVLALASAVVVTGEHLLPALAWGQACVTDEPGASSCGATDGAEVVVSSPARARDVALDLAADMDRAAALGRRGRRLAESRDLASAARAVARLLGVVPAGDLTSVAGRRLDELWTPPEAAVRTRVAQALDLLLPTAPLAEHGEAPR